MSGTGDNALGANVNKNAKDHKASTVMGGVGGKPLNFKNDGTPSSGPEAFAEAQKLKDKDGRYTKRVR